MSELTDAIFALRHANEFTDIENTAIVYVLRGWFAGLAGIPGALQAGDDVWALTTLHEHFTSLLNNDPSQRTATQLKIKDLLMARSQQAQDALDALLGAANTEDERMNAETDAFTKQVERQVSK
jgi:hypothetical protein